MCTHFADLEKKILMVTHCPLVGIKVNVWCLQISETAREKSHPVIKSEKN